ncbi:MAG TPA: UDP-N-acetylglucosamine 2-epimerase (non-hydrolyzing) [Gaiellaceae bacterium]|nr:UDP-N-acetylglucosamine 2-epimerase (non-hydrolyzing) [Gaiellaceae bacterium]
MTDLLVVVGARPNFVKAAPILAAAESAGIDVALLHTNQHYDDSLSRVFFDDLDLPAPHVELGIGSDSHARQTARIMLGFEHELLRIDPQIVVVVGDVNSTLACALVAAKEHYPVAHVEAGLRSFDERMPEEINRRLCDHVSHHLFTTSADADENLAREGVPAERVALVGNTMIDTLDRCLDAARERRVPWRLGLAREPYAVATLHRPENVDDPAVLTRLIAAIASVSRLLPVVLPLHPRTRERLEQQGLRELATGVRTTAPLGYLDFLGLVADAGLVLTDSGGLQEETTAVGVPCLTLRESTERPVTVTAGTNTVVGTDPVRIVDAAKAALERGGPAGSLPPLWDGHAAERLVEHLTASLERSVELAGTGS